MEATNYFILINVSEKNFQKKIQSLVNKKKFSEFLCISLLSIM